MMTLVGGGLGAAVASASRALSARADCRRPRRRRARPVFISGLSSWLTVGSRSVRPAVLVPWAARARCSAQATLFARVLFGGLLIPFASEPSTASCAATATSASRPCALRCHCVLQIVLTPMLHVLGLGLGLDRRPAGHPERPAHRHSSRVRYVLRRARRIAPASRFPRALSLAAHRRDPALGVPASLSARLNYIALVVLTGTVARSTTPPGGLRTRHAARLRAPRRRVRRRHRDAHPRRHGQRGPGAARSGRPVYGANIGVGGRRSSPFPSASSRVAADLDRNLHLRDGHPCRGHDSTSTRRPFIHLLTRDDGRRHSVPRRWARDRPTRS